MYYKYRTFYVNVFGAILLLNCEPRKRIKYEIALRKCKKTFRRLVCHEGEQTRTKSIPFMFVKGHFTFNPRETSSFKHNF